MSKKRSEMPPPLFSAAIIEDRAVAIPDLGEASAFLVRQGIAGLVFLDPDTIVTHAAGPLVAFVEVGKPVTRSILPLLGLEDELARLRRGERADLELANVSIQTSVVESPRININVYWRREQNAFTIAVHRVASEASFDLELQTLVRARLLAEEQLRQKSAELEQFAYIISHDLQTPLRALRNLSDDVHGALVSAPPDVAHAQAAAGDLIRQSRRMSSMLLGLLEYAQIGRRQEAIELVDSGALMDEVASGLQVSTTMKVVRAGTWPEFETFRAPLDLVLRNLVDNALKHHDRADGTVTASVTASDRYWVFSIADDGPGIPADWHVAIFEPFRTVETASIGVQGREGSGIGLALVKKTVETMNGRIDMQSEPQRARGTTFRVFWPKRVHGLAD